MVDENDEGVLNIMDQINILFITMISGEVSFIHSIKTISYDKYDLCRSKPLRKAYFQRRKVL